MRKFTVATLATIILLAMAVPAFAHVTVQPTTAPTGSFFKFDVRVPNERDDAETTKVVVDFPDNLTNVSFQPKQGWERTITMKELDEPIEVFGREVTEVVDTVTWEGGAIAPGEFDQFAFTARTPDDPGTLVFPSLQTYSSSGEEVAWIGEADSDKPAPRVELVAPDDESPSDDAATEGDDAPAADDPSEDGDDASTRATTALVLGGLGLLAGIGSAIITLRRR